MREAANGRLVAFHASGPSRFKPRRRTADRNHMRRIGLLLATLASLLLCASAQATTGNASPPASPRPPAVQDVEVPIFPAAGTRLPPGWIDISHALAVAKTSPQIQAIHRIKHPLQYYVDVLRNVHYEVFFFHHGKLLADVIVKPDGRLGPTYTGPQMLALYTRGHYGDLFDSPFVLVAFIVLFLAPLVLRRRPGLDQLDIGLVLAFFLSYGLFDHRRTAAAVWLAYPPLLVLMARMLWRGLRPRATARRFDTDMPTVLLAIGLLALVGARIGLTLAPSGVLDVGRASVIGASRILHGRDIYFPSLGHPDTYGAVNYLAYVPFTATWPIHNGYVFAARAATIAFDLLTVLGLIVVGCRARTGRGGRRLGLLLAWLWAACPFTLLGMIKSTNDGLVAMLLVWMIVALASPVRRGALLGLAAAAKFVPAVLLPLAAAGREGGGRKRARDTIFAFAVTAGGTTAALLPSGGIRVVWDHTLGFQLTRPDVFSPWALHPGLAPVKDGIALAVLALTFGLAVWPRGKRSVAQVSALAAALVIGTELTAMHWFYFYVVWFFPLLLIAVALGEQVKPSGGLARSAPPAAREQRERVDEHALVAAV
jgi:hypothetical protein